VGGVQARAEPLLVSFAGPAVGLERVVFLRKRLLGAKTPEPPEPHPSSTEDCFGLGFAKALDEGLKCRTGALGSLWACTQRHSSNG
jgi:hypothetical protein